MDRQAYTDWPRLAGKLLIGAAAALAPGPASAAPPPLRVLVDTGTEMPMAGFDDGRLVAGFHKDLGTALASRLGREAEFVLLPRKRIAMALDAGQADLICLYLPAWLPGDFGWSHGFFPVSEIVVTDSSVRPPHGLAELKGHPIATILGYRYPELDAAMGADFKRDDGHSSSGNLRKIGAGRLHHAITQQSTLDYYLKVGEKLSLHPPLVVKNYKAQCALSPRGQVNVGQLNKAIDQIVKDGSVARILNAYSNGLK
ncbi:substrate-binding periplasmic protein [Duganella callida]|uniref:Transporter substrate-binding domain-containing protein n=1 Tax=Duganella callida TaxID=2561932 RepID=A0A4Y9SD38_9BURK|nr:transporter substrate-binding domain-containing protein [Duganella callida]TFW18407.1 transporter substrate-binding domain-containing protein [Duganella callida]